VPTVKAIAVPTLTRFAAAVAPSGHAPRGALRKDADEALIWLERAFESGYRDHGSPELDPILAPLEAQARFNAVLERMGRDVAAQRTRAAERGLLDLTPLLTPNATR